MSVPARLEYNQQMVDVLEIENQIRQHELVIECMKLARDLAIEGLSAEQLDLIKQPRYRLPQKAKQEVAA